MMAEPLAWLGAQGGSPGRSEQQRNVGAPERRGSGMTGSTRSMGSSRGGSRYPGGGGVTVALSAPRRRDDV